MYISSEPLHRMPIRNQKLLLSPQKAKGRVSPPHTDLRHGRRREHPADHVLLQIILVVMPRVLSWSDTAENYSGSQEPDLVLQNRRVDDIRDIIYPRMDDLDPTIPIGLNRPRSEPVFTLSLMVTSNILPWLLRLCQPRSSRRRPSRS